MAPIEDGEEAQPRPEASPPPPQAKKRPRDIALEDADSPSAIPILPPRPDGS